MTTIILLVNLAATFALWMEVRRALALQWRASAAYAVGLGMWWLSAVMPAYEIGFRFGIYGIGK